MQFQSSAGLVLFRKKNSEIQYLLLHYPHGHWDLPKGKIEKGESKKEAALRELKEETGLSAEIIPGFEHTLKYSFTYEGQSITKTVYFFIGKAIGESITLSHEHVGSEWLSFDQAIERLTFDNARELLMRAYPNVLAVE